MTGQPHLVLVEDEVQQREVLQLIFEAEGYDVSAVESAEQALAHLASNQPQLLITDIKLPGMDGFSLYDAVRAMPHLTTMRTIFITAYNDPASIENAKRYGAAAYITKPYNVEDLLDLVKTILAD